MLQMCAFCLVKMDLFSGFQKERIHLCIKIVGINKKDDSFLKKAVKYGRTKWIIFCSFCNYLKILLRMENGISH